MTTHWRERPIGIVGLGLIGGSLGLDLQTQGLEVRAFSTQLLPAKTPDDGPMPPSACGAMAVAIARGACSGQKNIPHFQSSHSTTNSMSVLCFGVRM